MIKTSSVLPPGASWHVPAAGVFKVYLNVYVIAPLVFKLVTEAELFDIVVIVGAATLGELLT